MSKDLLLVPLPLWNVSVAACLLGLAVLGSHFLREFLRDEIVIRLGGFEWDRQCACQHFLITGATGAGKTLSGVLPILMQFFRNQPRFGGLCIDVKGVLHEQVIAIARHHGRSNDVLVLEVRPPEAGPDWRPRHRFNLVESHRKSTDQYFVNAEDHFFDKNPLRKQHIFSSSKNFPQRSPGF
jgi:hypothetical protein